MHTGPIDGAAQDPPFAEGVFGGVRVGFPRGHVLDFFDV